MVWLQEVLQLQEVQQLQGVQQLVVVQWWGWYQGAGGQENLLG